MSRWRKRAVWVACLVAVVAGFEFATRTDDLEEKLRRDAELAYAPRHRVTHVDDPQPVSFGETILAELPAIERSNVWINGQSNSVRKLSGEVRDGKRHFSELPDSFRDDFLAQRLPLQAVLRATHSARLEIPDKLSWLHDGFWRSDGHEYSTFFETGDLLLLDVRRLHASGDFISASRECVDAFALGRDLSYACGSMGAVTGTSITGKLIPVCAEVLRKAPQRERDEAVRELVRVREGWNTFNVILTDESLFARLAYASATLDSAERERFPVAAQEMMNWMDGQRDWWEPTIDPILWRRRESLNEKRLEAMRLPESMRALALARARSEETSAMNLMLGGFTSDMGAVYLGYTRTLARLTLLAGIGAAVSFREENGAWPSQEDLGRTVPEILDRRFTAKIVDGKFELSFTDTQAFTLTVDDPLPAAAQNPP